MKQILESYGLFLLDAVFLVLLLALLTGGIRDAEGNRGIFAMIGAKLAAAETENEEYREFDVYQNEAARAAPVIVYQNTGTVYTGTFRVSDPIKALGADGEELSVCLLSVCAPGAGEVFTPVPWGTEEVTFHSPGIYRLKVTAVDARRKRTTSVIAIPVNTRRI